MRKTILGVMSVLLIAAAAQNIHAADARADITAAMHQMAKPGSKYHTVGVNTSDGKTMKSSVDIIMPDHFHVIGDRAEIIVIPEGSWMKHDSTWQKLPMDMSRMIGQFTPAAMAEAEKNMSDAKFLGDGSINGEKAKTYSYTTTMSIMGIKSTSNAKIWVSDSSGRVIHMESDGSAMGKTTHTVQDITYDNSIAITPPN
jgi:hypothetical protein